MGVMKVRVGVTGLNANADDSNDYVVHQSDTWTGSDLDLVPDAICLGV